MRRFGTKKELCLLAAVCLAAALCFFLLRQPGGSCARLTFADGTQIEISLRQDSVQTFTQGTLPVTVQVEDGRCRIIHSVCPDHICEGFGWLQHSGQSAVCAPAGAVLQII